jgi:hypothetical protein
LHREARLTVIRARNLPEARHNPPMRNGLYSLHMTMIEAPGKGSAVLVARDGTILGGNGHVWFSGAYTFDERGRWKGELMTEPYALIGNRSLPFEREIVSIGFSGTYTHDTAETINTGFVGKRSIAFRFTMRWLAEA